jgi:hypothetical protein
VGQLIGSRSHQLREESLYADEYGRTQNTQINWMTVGASIPMLANGRRRANKRRIRVHQRSSVLICVRISC